MDYASSNFFLGLMTKKVSHGKMGGAHKSQKSLGEWVLQILDL
jgi:hypothetical protein